MRLTAVVLLGTKHFPRGNMWRGKFRLIKPMGSGTKASALKRLTWEYECMKLLAKPYLTEDQEASQPDWDKTIAEYKKHERMRLNMDKHQHRTMEAHLAHLNTTKNWG